jgi:hypothetical protein
VDEWPTNSRYPQWLSTYKTLCLHLLLLGGHLIQKIPAKTDKLRLKNWLIPVAAGKKLGS